MAGIKYMGPTPEDDLQRIVAESRSTARFFGGTFGEREECEVRARNAYMCTTYERDPFDATPDAYDYHTAYAETQDVAVQRSLGYWRDNS